MKALIVDDQAVNRVILQLVVEDLGYEYLEAEDGQQAVDAYIEHAPDLILMDVMMPVMDGYDATSKIKELAGERHVPVIFLTAKTDEESLLRCLECGGDDFLQKPVNMTLLHSKIAAHLRTQHMTNELLQKSDELNDLHGTLKKEHEMGQHVLAHALSRNIRHSRSIRSYLIPQSTFNGDILLSAEKPMGGLYVLLGDITGHGLGAAIGTIPLSQVFFTMTRKGKPLVSIVREMNRSLRSFLPRSMFCAATLMELSADGRKIRIWSGALPLCFHINLGANEVTRLPSKHLPLGVLDDEQFNSSLIELDLDEGDSVLLMTDGIPESTRDDGSMLGLEAIEEAVKGNIEDPFYAVLDAQADFVGFTQQEDDVSLLQVFSYPREAEKSSISKLVDGAPADLPWESSVTLNHDILRSTPDPVSALLRLLPERVEFAVFQERIATVITELFSNALEHGILGLDSLLKQDAQGFAQYYALREKGLAELSEGEIVITLSFDEVRAPGVLGLLVRDSGEGFDVGSLTQADGDVSQSFGRGRRLVESLCTSISYNEKGNEVRALIRLS